MKRLTGLLQRFKVDCALVEGDKAYDHCVLRLSSVKAPGRVAVVVYENQGGEPRVVTMRVGTEEVMWEEVVGGAEGAGEFMRLYGARKNDPEKIVEMVERLYLSTTKERLS